MSPRPHTAGVLGVAALLRLGVIWYALRHFPAGWFFTRGLEMRWLAESLLAGHGFGSPFGAETGPTALLAPAYPALVAAAFALCGVATQSAALLLMLLTAAANVATVWLVLQLARRFATERAAVVAGLIWACSPPLLWMPAICWETSFSCCLLLGGLVLALRLAGGRARLVDWLGFGGLCALGGWINPSLLPCLLAVGMLAAAFAGAGSRRKVVLATVVFALLYGPWPVRNAIVFHAAIPLRSGMGLELAMGNHAGSDGHLDRRLFPGLNPAELAEYRRWGEVAYMAGKTADARAWISANPVRFAWLTGMRVAMFWSGSGTAGGSIFYVVYALLTSLLGFWGLRRIVLAGHARAAWLLLIPLLVLPLPYYVTHAEFRYRLAIDPLLCGLAACALSKQTPRRVADENLA